MVNVSFDLDEVVGERIGIDCFFPSSPRSDERWTPVLDVARAGGAREDRLEAFQDWFGALQTPGGSIFRNAFIKLVVVGSQEPVAKAYLAFRSQNPGART